MQASGCFRSFHLFEPSTFRDCDLISATFGDPGQGRGCAVYRSHRFIRRHGRIQEAVEYEGRKSWAVFRFSFCPETSSLGVYLELKVEGHDFPVFLLPKDVSGAKIPTRDFRTILSVFFLPRDVSGAKVAEFRNCDFRTIFSVFLLPRDVSGAKIPENPKS